MELTIHLKGAIRQNAAAVADVRVPHEPWDSWDHVQLVGDAPAVRDALIIGASKGCISNPGGAKIVHRDAWALLTPISAAQAICTRQQMLPVLRSLLSLHLPPLSKISEHAEWASHSGQHTCIVLQAGSASRYESRWIEGDSLLRARQTAYIAECHPHLRLVSS